jgi:hypothetical protein
MRRLLIVLAVLVVASPPVQGQVWQIEVAEYGKQFEGMTDRSLRLDAQGHPHIAYGGDHLYYAFHDGVSWQCEVADASHAVGMSASLVLDASGWPHISYFDHTNDDLKYAYRDPLGWHTETVDAAGDVGRYTSLVLDGSGHPHIGYHDATNHDLKYARALGATPIVLTASFVGGQLVLSWTAVEDAAAYWVYGADNLAYFEPGLTSPHQHRLQILSPGTTAWASANGVGDPNINWTYLVLAVDAAEQVLATSNRVGEHDFATALSD